MSISDRSIEVGRGALNGKKQAHGGVDYRQKSDCVDGKLIVLGIPHDCDQVVVCRFRCLLRSTEKAIECKR